MFIAAQAEAPNTVLIVFIAIMGIVALILLISIFQYGHIFIRAAVSGAHIPFTRLVVMRLRKVNINKVVPAYIAARSAGLDISLDNIETHSMAGGHVENVISALVAANRAGIDASFDNYCAMDLAGGDPLSDVRKKLGDNAGNMEYN